MEKKKKWMKTRHHVVTELIRPIVALIAVLKYHIKVDRFAQEEKRNWLILSNHQTDFDQFFVGLAFHKPVYYVAMEDVFSNGWISKLIQWLVAPIPIIKGSTDLKAVMTCIRVAREGGNVALFPEGNRTYSGKTCYIKPSVAALAKKMGVPIAIFRIEGGYGIKPRWADDCRKGTMRAGVRRVIEPEEYQNMSKEELYELICRELWVDETEDNGRYLSKAAAEGLERVLYICPDCGLSEFKTKKDTLTCCHCGKQYRYLPDKRLEALEGKSAFRSVADWYAYQESCVRALDLAPYTETPAYVDQADLLEVIVFHKKQLQKKNTAVSLFADRLEIGDGQEKLRMAYDDIKAMACIAGHKLNIFYQDKIYQLRGGKSFNALKYCNIYYHAKYIKEEHNDGEFEFLGL